MKKILIAVVLLCLQTAFAHKTNPTGHDPEPRCLLFGHLFLMDGECDVCGCSASIGSMGFYSMLTNNFIGLRYIHQSYRSRDGVFEDSPWIEENFNTLQIWSRIPLSRKIELIGLVPYHFNKRLKPGTAQNINGLGDITLMGFYKAFQTMNDSLPMQHAVQIGAGIKAPTGSYDRANNGSVNPSFQLGTGSWDFSLATVYTARYKKYGFNTVLNYVIKTENDKNYKFGNQLNYGAMFFYKTSLKNFILVPELGVAGEIYAPDKDFGEPVPRTQGDILFGKLGIEAGHKRFSMGFNVMLPITQNLNAGRVEANYRFSASLNFSL